MVAAGVTVSVAGALIEPYRGFSREVFVRIARGTSTREIADLLERRGVIRHKALFLAMRVLRPRAVLQAGEYRFAESASPREVFDRFVRGDIYYHSFTVPEGANIFEVSRIVGRLSWIDREDFLEVARQPTLIADLAPDAESLEGYLFPSTYRVPRGQSAEEICRMMVAEFRRVWATLGSDADIHDTVTLAALVEKETGVPSERPLVASVFHNRLERGIKLECDPTVIYAAMLEDRYDGIIHRSDLDSTHPYNTYQHPGLPPGPIASPGRAALASTLHPAETNYLFFVAKPGGSGGHQFSETLAAHNRAVTRYRRGLQADP